MITRTMRTRRKVTTKKVLKSKRDRDLERIKERRMTKTRKRLKKAIPLLTRTVTMKTLTRRDEINLTIAAIETEITNRKTKRTKKVTKMAVTRKVAKTSPDKSQELDLIADLILVLTKITKRMRKLKKLTTTTITITTETDAIRAKREMLMIKINLKASNSNSRRTKITRARVVTTRITKSKLLLLKRFTCPSA